MIPKKIFTTWFSDDGSMPELVSRCIESQKLQGYEHKILTVEDLPKDNAYINQALASNTKKKWCKVSDYMRVHTLYNEGGIYVDADAEVLPDRNFDGLLDNKGFAGWDKYGWVGSAIQASLSRNPFYEQWLKVLDTQYRGDDDKIELTSYVYLTEQVKRETEGMTAVPSDYFYPYDFMNNTIDITDNTVAIHHFMRSWV